MRLALLTLGILACGGADDSTDDTESAEPQPASLTEPSGTCPDLSTTGTTVSLTSSGEERRVHVLLPRNASGPTPVVFFFHGLMDPEQTPDPADYMARALGLQAQADALGAIFLLPQAPTRRFGTFDVFLWNLEASAAGPDLTLYDDLRACAAQSHDVDLERVYATGFSGGALFTTLVVSQRADTLAGAVAFSGGADVDAAVVSAEPLAPYTTPAWALPVALVSGGGQDVWPNPQIPIIDFVAATDTLEARLLADDSFVVRCRHELGHTLPRESGALLTDWVESHRFGEPSPYVDGGFDQGAWCEVAAP